MHAVRGAGGHNIKARVLHAVQTMVSVCLTRVSSAVHVSAMLSDYSNVARAK